jgi:tetratricopeptide (TPR) repeat protein
MSNGDRPEMPRTLSGAIPAIPVPTQTSSPTQSEDAARARIAALEAEARGQGQTVEAALLFHEIGLLWESPLKHPRNAAVAYQSAFKLAPRFLANIRAARRLFAEVGNWVMVVQLIDAERQGVESKRTQAALLFEKGQILEARLSREADARASFAESLALEPEDVTLLIQLEQLFNEKADHTALVKVQRLLARVVADPAAKAHYLTAAGLLLEDRLKQLEEATACFREAFAIDRRDPMLIAAMKRVAQREGRLDEELAALAAEAEAQGANAGPTYLQISKAYERLSRTDDALAALLAARKVSPQDPLILSELARIYEGQGRHQELTDALLAWVGSITDESELIAVNLRLASLYEEHLKKDDEAISRYRAILTKVPGHGAALAGLGKLYHRAKNWEGLLGTFDAEIAAADEPKLKAGRIYKAAEVLEERLKQVDRAIERYNQCLQVSPGFLPAQKALSRLYEQQGRWLDLIAMYDQDLLQTTDQDQQIGTLNKMAAIFEDRLTDMPRATETLRRILEIAPDHLPTVRNLARLYERVGKFQELIELHDREATLSGDTKQVISLAHRNAEILEDLLKDRAGAIGAYEKVLALSPAYLPALKALGRLYGQEARWDALVRMYRAESEIAPTAEQAATLIYKIGELYEQKLKNENDAIASYQEVLTLSPSYFPAVRALARIYRSQGAWESLIEVLRAEAANRTDPTERANAMFQAAAIWEDQLKRPDNAIDGYQEVLRLTPGHTTALQQLERLLMAKDDVKELIAVLDRQTQVGSNVMRVAAWLKLARIYLDRLNEPQRAALCAENALSLETGNLSALKLLERIRVNDKLRRTELRARIAEVIGDQKLAAAMRLAVAESGVDSSARPQEPVVAQLKAAWTRDSTDEALSLMLERALQKTQDSKALIELYEHRKTLVNDPTDQLQLTLRIADLYEHKLADPARAVQAYEAALSTAPAIFPALQGLARCLKALGNLEKARATLAVIGETARDRSTATQALLEGARLAREASDVEGATALYRKILEADPTHAEAGRGIEEILAQRGGAADLAMLHERRGDAKLTQKDNVGAAAELFAAARVHLEQLKNRDKGIELLDRALLANPTLGDALEMKGDIALEAQNWAEAAAAFGVRVSQGGDPHRVASIHLKLGALYQDRLGDGSRATAHLQTALNDDPKNLEALERLATIHTQSANWSGAADCLNRLLEVEQNASTRARHTLSLAQIHQTGFNDPSQAAVLYKRAIELAPGDAATLDKLVGLYEQLGQLQELVNLLEQQAMVAPDLKRAVALKLRIGDIYARSLDNAQRAMATYRSVLDADASNVSAHVALAELFTKDPAAHAMAVESHRALLKLDPLRIESWHTLFRIWESHRQLDKAFCAAGVLGFLKRTNDVEAAFYTEGRNRLPAETSAQLNASEIEVLHVPGARNPVLQVFRAIGDQLVKVFPPDFEHLGIDKKADRLKPDHAVHKAVRAVANVFGVQELEVFQARRGLVFLETTEPISVCVGQDTVRRFNAREQKFLLGRAGLILFDKAAVLRKVSSGEAADLVGNSVRIHLSDWNGLGRKNEDHSKLLRKAYSRKAIKLLEEPAEGVTQMVGLNLDVVIESLNQSFDRAGLLLAGDVAAGLSMMLKDDNSPATKVDTAESVSSAVTARKDVRELLMFAVSDDFFRLRARLGLSLG